MMKSISTTIDRTHQGYTLIEILIAVVILSIGLLGMAGIQIKGMRGTQNTFLKSTATNLAQNIAERMHANPLGADAVESSPPEKKYYITDDTSSFSCSTVLSCNGTGANCTATDMAKADMFEWICGVKATTGFIGGINNSLPNGVGKITCADDPCTSGSTRTITISWDENNITPDPGTGDEYKTQSIVINTVP